MRTIDPHINPLKYLRMLAQKSQQNISSEAGLSKQYISTLEKGMHPDINWRYSRALIRLSRQDINPDQLLIIYNSWQEWKRNDSLSRIDPTPVAALQKFHEEGQPNFITFKNWRERYWKTPYYFCEDLCLKLYDVQRYERGSCRSMPDTIRTALEPLGLLRGFNYEAR